MLKRGTPYMLNKWGDLIEVESGHHPYILNAVSMDSIEDQVEQLVKGRPEDLIWCWEYADDVKVRNLIKQLLLKLNAHPDKYVDSYGNFLERLLQALDPDIDLHQEVGGDVVDIAKQLSSRINEEFVRVRTSHMTTPSTANQGIYFRISSKYTNWFDIIWKLVYDNRNWIQAVTIVTDLKSKGKETYYRFGNLIANELSTQEFLTLGGNPQVEGVKHRVY